MDKIPKRNVGTTLMILQEQTNHNKKLESIYSRSSVFAENRPKQDYLRRDKSNAKKKVISTFEK